MSDSGHAIGYLHSIILALSVRSSTPEPFMILPMAVSPSDAQRVLGLSPAEEYTDQQGYVITKKLHGRRIYGQ
jgi:hypothetical protein